MERLIGRWGRWEKEWAYFTEERLIVITGLLEENIVIPYQNIRALEKCSQGIASIGIAVTYENMEGKILTDKLSLMNREQWMSFIAERGKAN